MASGNTSTRFLVLIWLLFPPVAQTTRIGGEVEYAVRWYCLPSNHSTDQWLDQSPITKWSYFVRTDSELTFASAKTFCERNGGRLPAFHTLTDRKAAMKEADHWIKAADAVVKIPSGMWWWGCFWMGYRDSERPNGNWLDIYTRQTLPDWNWYWNAKDGTGWNKSERTLTLRDNEFFVFKDSGWQWASWNTGRKCWVVCQVQETSICTNENRPDENLQIVVTNPNVGSVECKTGYTRTGNGVATCTSVDGKWGWQYSSACIMTECPTLTLSNAAVTPTGQAYAFDNRTVTCDSGFLIDGSDSVSCNADGFWDAPPSCAPALCDHRIRIPNGNLQSTSPVPAFAAVAVICDPGYRTGADTEAICGADGTWETLPACSRMICSAIVFGKVHVRSTYAGGSSEVECAADHLPQPDKLTCLYNGSWSDVPICLQSCNGILLMGGYCIGLPLLIIIIVVVAVLITGSIAACCCLLKRKRWPSRGMHLITSTNALRTALIK